MSSEAQADGPAAVEGPETAAEIEPGSTAESKTIAAVVFLGLALFYLINAAPCCRVSKAKTESAPRRSLSSSASCS